MRNILLGLRCMYNCAHTHTRQRPRRPATNTQSNLYRVLFQIVTTKAPPVIYVFRESLFCHRTAYRVHSLWLLACAADGVGLTPRRPANFHSFFSLRARTNTQHIHNISVWIHPAIATPPNSCNFYNIEKCVWVFFLLFSNTVVHSSKIDAI